MSPAPRHVVLHHVPYFARAFAIELLVPLDIISGSCGFGTRGQLQVGLDPMHLCNTRSYSLGNRKRMPFPQDLGGLQMQSGLRNGPVKQVGLCRLAEEPGMQEVSRTMVYEPTRKERGSKRTPGKGDIIRDVA